jgi:hypothetical protein
VAQTGTLVLEGGYNDTNSEERDEQDKASKLPTHKPARLYLEHIINLHSGTFNPKVPSSQNKHDSRDSRLQKTKLHI